MHRSSKAIQNGEDLQQHLLGLEEVVGRQMLISALGLTPQDMALIKTQEQKLLDAQAELQRIAPFYGPAHPKVAELNERVQTHRTVSGHLPRSHAGERLAAFGDAQLGPLLEQDAGAIGGSSAGARTAAASGVRRRAAESRARKATICNGCRTSSATSPGWKRNTTAWSARSPPSIRIQLQAPIRRPSCKSRCPMKTGFAAAATGRPAVARSAGCLSAASSPTCRTCSTIASRRRRKCRLNLACRCCRWSGGWTPLDGDGLATVHTFVSPNAVETEAFRTLRTALTLGNRRDRPDCYFQRRAGRRQDDRHGEPGRVVCAGGQANDRHRRRPAQAGHDCPDGLKGSRAWPTCCAARAPGDAAAALRTSHRLSLASTCCRPVCGGRIRPSCLSGQNFVELLAWAEAKYDQVLVDCPPVLAVSDAQIVGRLVDGAILVVQPQKNHRRLVARACHSFSATGTNVLGIVANGLSPQSSRDRLRIRLWIRIRIWLRSRCEKPSTAQ